MKNVKIFSIGSCVPETRIGSYEALLEYGKHQKYISANQKDTTANRCIITGLIEALKCLKEPCHVELVTTTQIGLAGLKKNKGPNVDLLQQLIQLLQELECEFKFNEATGRGDEINAYIRAAKP